MSAIIPKGPRHHAKSLKGVMLFGVDLKDAREEIFVRMVCDGLTLGVAYARAGFKGTPQAAYQMFHLPRIQERAAAILEARRTQGVVTLPEVTDMLKRVFAGAHAEGEYSAAHNAAFSLARLYGHVTDKATLEVIRRPSRDPDAPSEQVLSDWVKSLPVVSGLMSPYPTLENFSDPSSSDPSQGPPSRAPAAPLGPEPSVEGPMLSADNMGLEGPGPRLDLLNDISGLGPGEGRAGTENGAPSSPVTGTPDERAHPTLLGRARSTPLGPSLLENGSPFNDQGTRSPRAKRVKKPKLRPRSPKIPSAKDLF